VHLGELVTLLGSNGAGNSTTLRAAVPAHRLLKLGIGHCPEGRRVIGRQSVADNLILGAYLRRDTAGIAADLQRCYGLYPRLAAGTCSKPASSPCRGQPRSCWPTPA
jgi:branched-chain amino acid transport system ATP-binding protein